MVRPVEKLTEAAIWDALEAVKDPEIPVVSVVEMGIVHEVSLSDENEVVVRMTPTFSGCPALRVMQTEIAAAIEQLGATAVTVEMVLSPPWSSDRISAAGRAKLKAFGLAPPPRVGGTMSVHFFDLASCPYCDSQNTSVKNTFGPTLCRAIYYCHDCQEPFEQFKPL